MRLAYVWVIGILILLTTACNGPISGTVIDAETDKPIEGAVVLVEWTKTRGLGLTSTESVKVVETMTDKTGKFLIIGGTNDVASYTHLVVYKKGYVAWNNEFIYPGYSKREDFKWWKGNVFKLEKFNENIYTHLSHVMFIYKPIAQESEIPKFYEALEWERSMMQKEMDKKGR